MTLSHQDHGHHLFWQAAHIAFDQAAGEPGVFQRGQGQRRRKQARARQAGQDGLVALVQIVVAADPGHALQQSVVNAGGLVCDNDGFVAVRLHGLGAHKRLLYWLHSHAQLTAMGCSDAFFMKLAIVLWEIPVVNEICLNVSGDHPVE